jgi:regulator of sigma E protease
MGFLADIFYFIIVIGVLVFIHEFGHFIAARLTGMRAEIFAVGMGYRLFGYNKISGFTFGKLPKDFDTGPHTDYRICALPIGGYVKIAGMVDESFDTEFKTVEPQDYEFRAKKTWQKTIVLSAGVIMNLLLALVIFAAITFVEGETDYATTKVGYTAENSLAERIGIKTGDEILEINDTPVNSWNQIIEYLTLKEFGKSRTIEIDRNGSLITLNADGDEIIQNLGAQEFFGVYPEQIEVYLDGITAGSPAETAKLQANDVVVALNNIPIFASNQFIDIVKANPSKEIPIIVQRDNQQISTSVRPGDNGLIGVRLSQTFTGEIVRHSYGFFESIKMGFDRCISTTGLFIGSIYQIIKGNLSFRESIGGPIMIAKYATQSADRGIMNFLGFMALLSISLAILNILPFPALDGGHLVFVLIEGAIKREVSIKVKMAFQQGGVIVLLLLMAFVFYNDILNAFFR